MRRLGQTDRQTDISWYTTLTVMAWTPA